MEIFGKLIRKILVFSINLYQKYLSPYKGYCCAHRVLHGGDSCSQYVKNVFIKQDLNEAIQLSRKRFIECGEAAEILASQKQPNQVNVPSANLARRTTNLVNRRAFIYLIIPAFFTFGLATPALASRGKGYAKCFTRATQATIRQDQKDGQCGNEPEVYYGLCCLGIIGAGLAHENK